MLTEDVSRMNDKKINEALSDIAEKFPEVADECSEIKNYINGLRSVIFAIEEILRTKRRRNMKMAPS